MTPSNNDRGSQILEQEDTLNFRKQNSENKREIRNYIGKQSVNLNESKFNETWAQQSDNEEWVIELAVDSQDNIIAVGALIREQFQNSDLLTFSWRTTHGFISKLSPESQLLWTYFSEEVSSGETTYYSSVSIDSMDNIIVGGFTNSGNLTTTSGAYDDTHN
ncbi:MAG: hypothetical protein ACXAD7_22050, partial [Candidatus Kariarchaeaceae archaeon]